MAYAKPCKFCNKISIVWRKEGERNIPVEAMTMEDHTREKCDAAKNATGQIQDERTYKITSPQQQLGQLGQLGQYSPQEQKEFVQQYRPVQQSEMQTINTKLDNLNIAIAKVMSMLQTHIENNPTQRDNMKLKQKITELEAAFEQVKEKSFVPANQVKQEQDKDEEISKNAEIEEEAYESNLKKDHDQHVRDMVAKGKQAQEEEELDLT